MKEEEAEIRFEEIEINSYEFEENEIGSMIDEMEKELRNSLLVTEADIKATVDTLSYDLAERMADAFFYSQTGIHRTRPSVDKPVEEDPYESMSEAERAAIFEWDDE